MIIHDSVVGKQLSMWCEQAAADRQEFEQQLCQVAHEAGLRVTDQ